MARYVIDAATLLHLLDSVRRGRRTEADALEVHERMTELKLRLLGDRVSRRTAWKIAREDERTSLRDAEHLAITRLQADALVTTDPALAARAAGVVPVAPLSVLGAGT